MSSFGNKRDANGNKKSPLTHFLCLPLVTPASRPQLQASVGAFRDAVCALPSTGSGGPDRHSAPLSSNNVDTTILWKAIRPVGALHFTLGVMSLGQDQLNEAVKLLQSPEVMKRFTDRSVDRNIESTALRIDLKGLVPMHAPESTSILYAEPVDSTQRLYSFCVSLQELFKSNGFLVVDDRPLKLHATVVNTIYAKGNRKPPRQKLDSNVPSAADGKHGDRSQGHGPNAKAPIKLNARSLIEKYKDHVWAYDVPLDRVAICEMGAKKILDAQGNVLEERYTEVAHVALPT